MSASPVPRLTPEEYLAIEHAAEFKSEYYDGQMYAMSGGTYPHAVMGMNLLALMWALSRGKHCSTVGSDLRLRVAVNGLYTYPDGIVICGKPEFSDDQKDTLLNPALIVEVLLNFTEAHDRGFKFAQYRQLESLREYVLVSQTEPRVELFRREPAGWILGETVGIENTVHVATLDGDLKMADIYVKVPGT